MDLTTVLLLLGIVILAYVYARINGWLPRKEENKYQEGHHSYLRTLNLSNTFTSETVAGFKVLYRLDLLCKRVNNEEFNRGHMLSKSSQTTLAMSFNSYAFRRYLESRSCFFHLEFCPERGETNIRNAVRIPFCGVFEEEVGLVVREIRDIRLITEVNKEKFKHGGCEVELVDFPRDPFCREIVEENYAMLTKDQRDAILRDDRFGEYEEMLAVAALKRRLDFLDNKTQKYESEKLSIETERVGRGLKIKWHLREGPVPRHDIVGFRRTAGFFADEFDETNNGTLVVHADKDGDVVELLKEGEANFYTFFLRPRKEKRERDHPFSSVRFQVTIARGEEVDAIKKVVDRIEERSFNPERKQDVSRALKELGLYIEFDSAIEQREKALARQIETAGYGDEEKKEKLSRLREVVSQVRDKYNQ